MKLKYILNGFLWMRPIAPRLSCSSHEEAILNPEWLNTTHENIGFGFLQKEGINTFPNGCSHGAQLLPGSRM